MKLKTDFNSKELLTVNHQIRVRFNETDPLGIVWHGYYLHYFEDGREAFGRQFGLSYLDVKNKGFATPIIKTTTEHKHPLVYGDLATVETTFVNNPAAKLIFRYVIKNEANVVVCVGETVQVFTDINTGILAIPQFFKDWKQVNGLMDA